MALIPMFYNELNDYFNHRGRNFDQLFGDFAPAGFPRGFYAPRGMLNANPGETSIQKDKNTFEVTLDVQHFSPKELTVKAIDNNCIVVEGKHEEKQDEHGFISRHFIRKYKLPKDHDSSEIASNLSSDGILTIVSKTHKMLEANERHVPITLTGPSKPAVMNGANKEVQVDSKKN